ncbi:MAG: hypothetical protein WD226_09245 [Planctomycetota bacterium]
MNPLLLLGGLASMSLSAAATLVWLNERDFAELDRAQYTGLLDDEGRVALEGRSFRAEPTATGPSTSRTPRGLPSDPDAPALPTGMGALGASLDHESGEHASSRGSVLDAPVQGDDGYFSVDFAHLLFEGYDPPELRAPEVPNIALADFPEHPRALHDQPVVISGFMIAVDWKDRKIDRFLLGRFPPGCCFGQTPLFDEWIEVDNTGANSEEFSAYETITVRGTLDVGEVLDDDGYVLSLYRLKADSVRALY